MHFTSLHISDKLIRKLMLLLKAESTVINTYQSTYASFCCICKNKTEIY